MDRTIRDSNGVYGIWIEMLLCNDEEWRKGLALKGPQVDPQIAKILTLILKATSDLALNTELCQLYHSRSVIIAYL